MKKLGLQTISLPGLRVWHPPHNLSETHWQFVYDWRNSLINKALHLPHDRTHKRLILEFYLRASRTILGGFYETAESMLMGLDEYLQGPSRCVMQESAVLKRAHSVDGMYSDNVPLGSARLSEPNLPRWNKAYMALYILSFNGALLPSRRSHGNIATVLLHRHSLDWRLTFRYSRIAISNSDGTRVNVTEKHLFKIFTLFAKLTMLAMRYWISFQNIRRLWTNASSHLSSPEFWRDYTRR
jgi:hypothetical protein